MTKYLTNNFAVINLHKRPSSKSEVVTQMIYGDSFSISKKTRKWLKVKIKEDGYKGYVQNKNFSNFLKPTHKINILKAKVYKLPSKRKKTNEISEIKNILGFQGSYVSDLFFQSIGFIAYLIPVTFFFTGINVFRTKDFFLLIENTFFIILYLIFGSLYFDHFYKEAFTLYINGSGGFIGNLERIIPDNLSASVSLKSKYHFHKELFSLIEERSNLTHEEMLSTFNCGIGMILSVPKDELDKTSKKLKALNMPYLILGKIQSKGSNKKINFLNG